jgi:dihydroorotate dehydrogenase electron transfer subunit
MSQFQQKVELIQVEGIARDVVRLTFHAPDIVAAASPGQFVMVQVAPGRDPLLRRPFSIHQTSSAGTLQILFKVVGRGTKLLAERRAGEQLALLGPLGKGFNLGDPGMACLIGGGIGIAPLLFLASRFLRLTASDEKNKETLKVILGARNREELFPLLVEFQRLGIEAEVVTDDGTLGHHGLVTDVLKKINLSFGHTVYCCGPRPMMAAIYHQCQQQKISCQVSMETVMACGMGACLGCAVPLRAGGYGHVCSDGPVFEADELLWSL